MYLTRFRINAARRGARHLLASPQRLHAAVMAGFVDPSDHEVPEARILWRLDQDRPQAPTLYLMSPQEPDLTHLVEQAGWPTTESWQTKPYGRLLDSLAAGQRWAFRLTANPSKAVRPDGDSATAADGKRPRSKRYGQVTVAQQTDWLTSRAERCGFTITQTAAGDLNLVIRQRQLNRFDRRPGDKPVTIQMVGYDGVLEVADPQVLRRTMIGGLGRAKAYGCGLLTLAPAG